MSDRRQKEVIFLRLPAELVARVKEEARANDVSVNEYLRAVISNKPGDYKDIRVAVRNLTTEINHIGNNINQITRNNNSGLYSQEDKKLLMAYMESIIKKMARVVEIIADY